jgi:hypothetical protein
MEDIRNYQIEEESDVTEEEREYESAQRDGLKDSPGMRGVRGVLLRPDLEPPLFLCTSGQSRCASITRNGDSVRSGRPLTLR